MAQSLRQAYDYWQDQPGNYFPYAFPPLTGKKDIRPILVKLSLHVLGREFSLFHDWIFCISITASRSVPAIACLTNDSEPVTKTPCSPISQISGTVPPVVETTEIVTFNENYQQPASVT